MKNQSVEIRDKSNQPKNPAFIDWDEIIAGENEPVECEQWQEEVEYTARFEAIRPGKHINFVRLIFVVTGNSQHISGRFSYLVTRNNKIKLAKLRSRLCVDGNCRVLLRDLPSGWAVTAVRFEDDGEWII
jgi:hypothetical protein